MRSPPSRCSSHACALGRVGGIASVYTMLHSFACVGRYVYAAPSELRLRSAYEVGTSNMYRAPNDRPLVKAMLHICMDSPERKMLFCTYTMLGVPQAPNQSIALNHTHNSDLVQCLVCYWLEGRYSLR